MSLPLNNTTSRNEIFIDPSTGRGLRIYLDTTHIKDHVFSTLRNVIESGGGCVASNKEDASIWIVDPEAPYALGEWKDDALVVLFAPWLLACTAHGAMLGADEGSWCGFKVAPKVRQKIVLKQGHKKKVKLQLDRWPPHLKATVFRTPAHSLPPVGAIPLDAAPVAPPEEEWGAARSDGKRPMSVQERIWLSEVVEWCIVEYPGMNLYAMCDVMCTLGWHRKKEGYQMWITRNMGDIAQRSPHFLDLLLKIQAENEAELLDTGLQGPTPASSQTSQPQSQSQTPKSTPAPKPARAPKPGWYYEGMESSEADEISWTSNRTPFTDEDRLDFIRFAAARPTGMEPRSGESAMDVWKVFVEQYPSHSYQSWRSWHGHRRAELKTEIDKYRATHIS